VTPIQMAVMVSTIANGGKVLWPRLVSRVEPQDPASGEVATNYPSGVVRDRLTVRPRSLQILRSAMLADVEDPNGTGRAAYTPDMRICAKTGTAQVQDAQGNLTTHTVWLLSFAPYAQPKYAVVVMIEGGSSGGGDCAPLAGDIYRAIVQWEKKAAAPKPLARN